MNTNPSSILLIKKAFSLSLSNIWRNKFMTIATIFVIGTIIFIFNTILAVNSIAKEALNDINKKIDIVVYLQESTTLAEATTIMDDIKTLEGVDNVAYTSKEDALNKLKQTHPDITIAFEKYNLGNPLPASINITTIHPKYHASIAEFLSQDKYQAYLSSIITGADNENNAIITSVSQNLLEVTNFANQVIFWLVMIFIIGGALIILNAIQITIFSRKKEIGVMKLVGAPLWFIRLPFIIESVIYGLLAVFISFIMLMAISKNIEIKETSLFSYYSGIEFYKIFLIEIAATTILSIASAMLAVHEYLQKRLLEE